MYDPNVEQILAALTPTDLVLDVGGWACPFNRAQWVLDSEPFETRGFYRTFGGRPSQGPAEEWFTRDRWVQRDICAREPWPFEDQTFDFAVCSHTLEDLRDPLWVCSELMRVARRGYIEVPSREYESCRGVERPTVAGLSHHRWLIDISGDRITFLQKYHFMHGDWRLSLPPSFVPALRGAGAVQWLWWSGRFETVERLIHGTEAQERELEEFVRARGVYPWCYYAADRAVREARGQARRVARWAKRTVLGAPRR